MFDLNNLYAAAGLQAMPAAQIGALRPAPPSDDPKMTPGLRKQRVYDSVAAELDSLSGDYSDEAIRRRALLMRSLDNVDSMEDTSLGASILGRSADAVRAELERNPIIPTRR